MSQQAGQFAAMVAALKSKNGEQDPTVLARSIARKQHSKKRLTAVAKRRPQG